MSVAMEFRHRIKPSDVRLRIICMKQVHNGEISVSLGNSISILLGTFVDNRQ
jgi:hypothetical protein